MKFKQKCIPLRIFLPWCIFLYLLVFTCNIFAQYDHLRIAYFGLEDGLSQVSSNDLLKDSSGFVWIATEDGLNRFDGREFKHFMHSATDSLSISGNQITKLTEDKAGNIWVGTNGKGLNYYDRKFNVFHRFKLNYSKDQNELISDILISQDGAIWVASKKSGLHRLQIDENGAYSQKNFIPNNSISSLFLDNDQILWIGDFNGQIFQIDTRENSDLQINPVVNIGGQIRSFFYTDEHLLIGSDLGFYMYNFTTKKINFFELDETGESKILYVSSFLEAGNNAVWVGSGSGIFLFDWIQMKVLKKIEYFENRANGLSNNTVLSLLQLTSDQILVGTSNQLNLIDFSEPYFKNISKDQLGKHLLNDNVVFSIYKENENLWIGTSDGGLNLIRNKKTYYFKEDQNDTTSISSTVIRGIVKDEVNNRLWLATTRGLSMIDLNNFDPNNPKFIVFQHDPNDINTINMDFLKGIALDNNNNVWGATFGHGIFRLEMSRQNEVRITRYKNQSDNLNSLKNNITQCIQIDKENNIWIGTQGGLSKLYFNNNNYKDPVFTNYYRDENSVKPLSHNSVYDILLDRQNRVWVATRNGLNLFLGNNEFDS